ncbi:hypothetical protein [Modestobacter sp. NPDC049651]|uniref:hypothetical protein n=1 Tax=unclassified Modestobacter TaxID=2643866 RepID=UPI0033D63F3E
MPLAPLTVPADPAVTSAVARLAPEYRRRVGTLTLVSVVRTARGQLSGVPETALPEMVERLARHRLDAAG